MTKLLPAQKETAIVRSCLTWLNACRFFAWRNNTTGVYRKGAAGAMQYLPVPGQYPGAPDLFAVLGGKIYGIECKSAKGKQTQDQKFWQERFEKAGGIYILVRSLDDLMRSFKQL